ncbi:SitI3 family protein [Polymorphospora rubra]|uniref:SitI3 family protein n=1 Tax=Polymorphospora rubra TaxID=338584 RepID=UPI0033C89FD3
MGIEYRLTLAGELPLERVAELAAPEATELPAQAGYPRAFGADLNDRLGYSITIIAGTGGYYDAQIDDDTSWVWEPAAYVDVDFDIAKDAPGHEGKRNMMVAVDRLLAGLTEDAALVLNGNWLLLTRLGGQVVRHNPDEWYDEAYDGILPG